MGWARAYCRVVITHAVGTWAPRWPGHGTVTITSGNTNVSTKHITLPPKNWRWFLMLRLTVAGALPLPQVLNVLAKRHDLDRRHPDAIRHKRKRFIQSLRSAA